MRLSEIAVALSGRLEGADLEAHHLAAPDQAGPGDLVVIRDARWLERVLEARAAVVVAEEVALPPGTSAVRVPSVEAAWPRLLELFAWEDDWGAGVHPTAVIEPGAEIAPTASVGAFACVRRNAVIGPHVVVGPYTYVGEDCRVEEGTVLEPRVTLHRGTVLGPRCRVMAGAVIGAAGFGFQDGRRLAHTGRVVLEEAVEVGPQAVIERSVVGEVRVGAHTKIGGAVYVGHNARIGRGVVIVSQSGLGGSVTLEDGVVLAGQVGVADHVTVGAGARVGAKSGVTKDVPPGETWGGIPARPIREYWRRLALLDRIEELFKRLREGRDDG